MKKLLAFILAGVMVLSLAACGSNGAKGVKVTLTNEEDTIAAEIAYPENAGIEQSGNELSLDLEDQEEGYYMNIEIYEHDLYEYYKSGAEEDETFAETKIGGKYAFTTDDGDSMQIYVLLEDQPVEDDVYRYASILIDGPLNTDTDIKDFVKDNKDIQSILNSFKYLGETKAE